MTNDTLVNGCPCDYSRIEGDDYEVRIYAESSAARSGLREGDSVTLTYCATSFQAVVGRLVVNPGRGR